jgi:DNA polymerase-1
MDRYLLVDGLNLAYRCFFAVPELTNIQGVAVNALQGWVRALWSLEERLHPQVVIVFFDQGISTQRRAILASYKANRPPMPEAMQQQLSSLKQLSQYMGYHIHSQEGVEADDLIASAAQYYTSSGHSIFIASADKDLVQCVSGQVTLLRPSHQPSAPWKAFDPAAVQQHWGIYPEQMIDYLALIGDASDNIPGISGVGPKTAQQWLQSFGNIEGIYRHLERIIPTRFTASLPFQREQLEMNRRLIRLERTLPMTFEAIPVQPQEDKMISYLEQLRLPTLATQARRRYDHEESIRQLSFDL